MEQIDRSEYPLERIQRLLSGIPFFNEVSRDSTVQFTILHDLAEIMQAKPGERVISEGDSDTYLYFLLKGQLAVLARNVAGEVLNYISPGEVFGALAMIRATPRTASIVVDESAKEAIFVRLNYSHFNNRTDFSLLSIETKLSFYRMLAHNIRWTLEVNKMRDPQHELVATMRKVPIYNGEKGGQAELVSLAEQSHQLADILCLWNESGATPSATTAASNLQVT